MTLGTTKQVRELLGFITPDEFRQINLKKSRAMTNKIMDIKSAINKFVKDGDYLGIGGFGMDRIPSSSLH